MLCGAPNHLTRPCGGTFGRDGGAIDAHVRTEEVRPGRVNLTSAKDRRQSAEYAPPSDHENRSLGRPELSIFGDGPSWVDVRRMLAWS